MIMASPKMKKKSAKKGKTLSRMEVKDVQSEILESHVL